MNILLTTACSKSCSFCFARERNAEPQEMSRENFEKLLDFIQCSKPVPFIKLLGGEPTQHSQFVEFVAEVLRRKLQFGLISNGLYTDEKIRQQIEQTAQTGQLQSILFNVSELNTDSRLQTFSANYLPLEKIARQQLGFRLSCGITLHRDWSVERDVAYVRWLLDNLAIHNLRISIDFQGNNKEDLMLLGNTAYGEKIVQIMQECLRRQVVITGDCIVYPCQFTDQFVLYKKVKEFIHQTNFICYDNTMPLDVYPDLSYFHCYPASDFGGKTILAFNTYESLIKDMELRKKALNSLRVISETCKKCTHFQNGVCGSLCLGCSQLAATPLLQALA